MDDPLPDLGPLPGPHLPPADPMVLPDATGAHVLGAPTVDSDADGAADTVLLGGGPAGDPLVLATDLDGDHDADVVTTVDAAGSAVTRTAGADGRFAPDAPVPLGHAEEPAPPVPGDRDGAWAGLREGPPPPAPTIDPATGAWTRGADTP